MSKIIKIGIILFIILFITISNVYALDMNLSPIEDNQGTTDQTADNANSENVNNENTIETNEQADIEDDILTPTTTNNQSSIPESSLGLTNTLNILLIVIGFVLILLGIAIILRLR